MAFPGSKHTFHTIPSTRAHVRSTWIFSGRFASAAQEVKSIVWRPLSIGYLWVRNNPSSVSTPIRGNPKQCSREIFTAQVEGEL